MRRFIDLLQYNVPTEGKTSARVTSQLEELLSKSNLTAWHLGDPVPVANHRVLIGIATWSGYDLRLLDALKQAGSQERIDVFDIEAEARASSGYDYLKLVIPEIGKIYQTPVVGLWENNVLKQCGSGFAGRKLIIDRYNLNNEEIIGQKGHSS